MILNLKTNRNDLIKWWIIPFAIVGLVYAVMIINVYCFDGEKSPATKPLTIIGAIFLGLYLLGILLVKYCDRKKYILSSESIQVFKRKKLVSQINIEDIVRITYIRLSGNYIRRIIMDEATFEGNACQMYVGLKNGNLLVLGSLSTRDAKKIKKLYGDLVQII